MSPDPGLGAKPLQGGIIPSIGIILTSWDYCYKSSQMITTSASGDADDYPLHCSDGSSGLLLELFSRKLDYFKSLEQAGWTTESQEPSPQAYTVVIYLKIMM